MYKHTSHFSIIKALNRYAVWKLLLEVNLTLKLASQTLKQSSPSRWRFINHNPIGGQVLIFGWMRGVLVYISSLSMCKFRNGTPFSFNVTCYSDFLNNTTFIQSMRLHQVMSLCSTMFKHRNLSFFIKSARGVNSSQYVRTNVRVRMGII